MTFDSDFQWQAKYYPYIKQILLLNCMHLVNIEVADDQEDMKHATDFIINIKGGKVAVRIRRNVGNSFRDLTIRSRRPSGAVTELQKIKEGYADFYLYMWTNNDKVLDWWLVDINKIRRSGILNLSRRETWNKDGSSAFIALNSKELQNINAFVSTMETI